VKFDKRDEIDLKDIAWAKDIVKVHSDNIPVLPEIHKGTPSVTVTYRSPLLIHQMAENIVYLRTSYFQRPSQVYRAAMHIGMSILYDICSPGVSCPAYKRSKKMEDLYVLSQELDMFIKDVSTLKQTADQGIISEEERDERIDEMIRILPKELHKTAHDKAARVLAGKKVSSLSEHKTYGGDRKSISEE
jgi:hypothetical protein